MPNTQSPRRKTWFGLTATCLLVLGALQVAPSLAAKEAEGKEAERLARAAEVFAEILNAPDRTLPRDLLDRSRCIAVIPSMLKAGLVIGGRYGKGVISCRKEGGTGAWGPPSMITLGGGSFGLQIGGAAVDVVMLVINPSGIENLLQDKFTLGGDVSAAAGPVGRAATAETDAKMDAKILTYSRSRGLFAGVELKGAAVFQDREGNRALYGREIDARELLLEASTPIPAPAKPFIDELDHASPLRRKKLL